MSCSASDAAGLGARSISAQPSGMGRLWYDAPMARRVLCRIADRPDGLFDVTATIEPDKTFRREGIASLAEAERWIEGLRALMTALGAPVLRIDAAESEATADPPRAAVERLDSGSGS